MVARRTHGNKANHRHVIEGWPLLKRLDLTGSFVNVTLACPSLLDLSVADMHNLKTCRVVSPVLSKLCVDSCPHLDVSSMILPSLEYVDVLKCNVSAMILICVEVVSFSDDIITCLNERGSYNCACWQRRAVLLLPYTFFISFFWCEGVEGAYMGALRHDGQGWSITYMDVHSRKGR